MGIVSCSESVEECLAAYNLQCEANGDSPNFTIEAESGVKYGPFPDEAACKKFVHGMVRYLKPPKIFTPTGERAEQPRREALKCPAGMVLQSPEGAVHTDEPAFCISESRVANGILKDGDTGYLGFLSFKRREDSGPGSKFHERFHVQRDQWQKIRECGTDVGLNPPAISVLPEDARDYCRWRYPGGDLPTERQWENACGRGDYCESKRGALYFTGFPDVGSMPPNERGVRDMLPESVLHEFAMAVSDESGDPKHVVARGGSFKVVLKFPLKEKDPYPDGTDQHSIIQMTGFRCVAPVVKD